MLPNEPGNSKVWKLAAPVLFAALAALPLAGKARNADSQAPAAGSQNAPAGTSAAGAIPLNTDLTVRSNVTAQAVLIPRKIAKAVFGGKIASEYAVVELTITNKSSDAALIVQGVYLDYRNWGLAGGGLTDAPCPEENSNDPKSKYKACTESSQVASEEYRVVRGQALNAQPWTPRNLVVRGLTLVGTVASAYGFTVSGTKYSQAVSAGTGQFIPGMSAFWPDQTVDQINRISDFGYQTNKVISKQGSDIIVCFFPIERFLSKGFRDLFLKNPSLFFAPNEMLLDAKIRKTVSRNLPASFFGVPRGGNMNQRLDELAADLPCYLQMALLRRNFVAEGKAQREATQMAIQAIRTAGCTEANVPDADFRVLDALGAVSLNNAWVVVDGVMSVNTGTMRAKIDKVTIDKESDTATWKVPSGGTRTITGTITGSYLTGGTPLIQEAKADQITKIAAVSEGSNDQTLKFSFDLGKDLKAGDQLTFVVEKTTKDSNAAPEDSAPYLYQVPIAAAAESGQAGGPAQAGQGAAGQPGAGKPAPTPAPPASTGSQTPPGPGAHR